MKLMKEILKGKILEELTIGEKAYISKTITESDVYNFAGVTGDFNPAHINEEYAKGTMFKTRIAHGMLGMGFISAVIGTKLPGPGTIYLGQEIKFTKPVKIGDTVTAEAEIKEIIPKGKINLVKIQTRCYNQLDEIVMEGMATVMPPK